MKKYITPILEEEIIEIEDVIASSNGSFGGDLAGDSNGPFWSNELPNINGIKWH